MDNLFGKDYLGYHYDKSKVCFVNAEDSPDFEYNHDEWEDGYYQTRNCTPMSPQSPSVKKSRQDDEQHAEQKSKPAKRCLFTASNSNSCPLPSGVRVRKQPQSTQKFYALQAAHQNL